MTFLNIWTFNKGNFNIWKESIAKLSLSLFLIIDLKNKSYIVHLMSYSPLIDTRGVAMYLAHEMRQNTDTWFSIF